MATRYDSEAPEFMIRTITEKMSHLNGNGDQQLIIAICHVFKTFYSKNEYLSPHEKCGKYLFYLNAQSPTAVSIKTNKT